MIDIHSHIIPEIDDGPPDWNTSLEMCRIAAEDGVTTMVASPHMLDGMYNVKRDIILSKVDELQERLRQKHIDLVVLPGADVHVDVDLVDLLQRGELVTINDTGKYILIEFPHEVLPPSVDKLLFSIRVAGVTPIITHPERHYIVQKKPELVYQWAAAGNLIQVTAASLTGDMGKSAKECSLKFLKQGIIHLVASDAHSATWRPPGLSSAYKLIAEHLSEDEANQIFVTRPRMIIEGKELEIPVPEPVGPGPMKSFFGCRFNFPWKKRRISSR